MATSVRGQEIDLAVKLIAEECCNCGVVFAMSAELRRRRLNDHESFWCPNGHSQAYVGKTEAQKLREQLQVAENRVQWAEDSERLERERRREAEGSLRATRGQVTKLRKRVVAGACPFGCRRHFADLERHVATKHEGATLPGETE